MTAAVGIYLTLGLPEPWKPLHTGRPLIIYGASGALGSVAIQLAQLSNINTYAGMSSGPEENPNLTDSVTGGRDFGYVMYRFFGQALEKGFLKGHPHKVVIGGLGGVQTALTALNDLKSGQASGVKYIFQIADTRGV